jgi:hypothetical protein
MKKGKVFFAAFGVGGLFGIGLFASNPIILTTSIILSIYVLCKM